MPNPSAPSASEMNIFIVTRSWMMESRPASSRTMYPFWLRTAVVSWAYPSLVLVAWPFSVATAQGRKKSHATVTDATGGDGREGGGEGDEGSGIGGGGKGQGGGGGGAIGGSGAFGDGGGGEGGSGIEGGAGGVDGGDGGALRQVTPTSSRAMSELQPDPRTPSKINDSVGTDADALCQSGPWLPVFDHMT